VKGFDVAPDLTLRYHRVFLLEDVLDRVFHAHNPVGALFADSIDQRGNGRRFTGAGDSGHKNQAVLAINNIFPDVIRKTDVLYLRNVHRQRTDCPGKAVVFHENVYSKLKRAEPVRAVHAALFLELRQIVAISVVTLGPLSFTRLPSMR